MTTINEAVKDITSCFKEINAITEVEGYEHKEFLPPEVLQDQYARFRLWAGSLGAFRRSMMHSSLDYRLREATTIRDYVFETLAELKSSLDHSTSAELIARVYH